MFSSQRPAVGPTRDFLADANDGLFQAMPDNFQAAGRPEVLWGHPADLERKEAWAIYQAVEVRDPIRSRIDRGLHVVVIPLVPIHFTSLWPTPLME